MPGRNPWVVLCVSEDASYQEVQRSFRRMVKQTHPDGGGDARRFDTVVRAFDDVRRTLPRENLPTAAPTPYDSWLGPVRLLTSWTDDGGVAPWRPGGPADGATTPVEQAGAADFTAVLEREMARVRTLTTV